MPSFSRRSSHQITDWLERPELKLSAVSPDKGSHGDGETDDELDEVGECT